MRRMTAAWVFLAAFGLGRTAVVAGPYCPSGPLDPCTKTKGDPVDVINGFTFERFDDVRIESSVMPLRFVRYYTSFDNVWDDTSYDDLQNVPGPFGPDPTDPKSVRWWHQYFSFVSQVYTDVWTVRAPGGELLFYQSCSAPCWATADYINNSLRDRLYYDGRNFTLIRDDGTQYLFQAKHVAYSDRLGQNATRMFLSSVRTREGQTAATIAYAAPAANGCASGASGSDTGVPWISTITTAEGLGVSFIYTNLRLLHLALPQPDPAAPGPCVIGGLNSLDGTPLMTYSYQYDEIPNPPSPDYDACTGFSLSSCGGPGWSQFGVIGEATRMPQSGNGTFTEDYTNAAHNTNDFFTINGPGGVIKTQHNYATGGDGDFVSSATGLYENLTFDAPIDLSNSPPQSASTPTACIPNKQRQQITYHEAQMCPGDGVNSCSYSYQKDTVGMELYPAIEHGRFYWSQESTSGSASSWFVATNPESHWACQDTTSSPPLLDHPIGDKDERGGWTSYTYQQPSASSAVDGTAITLQQTELATVGRGATSISGSGALLTANQTFAYGATGQQLPASKSQPSVIHTGQAQTYFTYHNDTSDPKGNRLTSAIRHGWTETLSGSTWSTTERYVGVFFFTNHACLGDSNDSQRRTLEVHGPCLVAGTTSTDCDGGGIAPIKQYFYNGTGVGNASGQLQKVRQLTSGTPSSCSSASYLETDVNSYDNLGHPTQVTDPNGIATTVTWAGPRVTSMTRSSQAWSFTYDHDKLTRIQYPQGNNEVLCYRTGSTGACSGGTWTDHLQWRARYNSTLSTSTERVDYSYWSDGTVQSETFSDSTGTRRIYHHGANVLRQPTYFKAGEDTSASTYRLIRQFDGSGDVTAIGFPFNNPPDFCGSAGSVSPYCAATNVDALGRLASLDQVPNPSNPGTVYETRVAYDSQGNISAITPNCATSGTCSSPGATYQYDDFGNLVSVTAAWLDNGAGSNGTTNMEYDPAGHLLKRQTPEMARSSEYLSSPFDMLGRQTALAVQVIGGSSTNLYSLTYDGGSTPSSSCDQPANTSGRLLKRTDSFGDTWYAYDSFGRVTEEIRLRTGVSSCSSASPNDIQNTKYAWSANGNLLSLTYPFGRVVTYIYGNSSGPDRPTSISFTQYNGSSWSAAPGTPLISGIIWEPYGGLRAYIIDDQTACAPTYVNYRHVQPGGSTDVHTGLLGSLTVSTTETGYNIYRRDYTWQADQVTETDTYLLGATTPRKETYNYDALLRLSGMTGMNFATVGGAVGSRIYGYDGRGNRTSQTNEDCGYGLTYGSSAHPDQLTQRASSCTGSILSTAYSFDRDGRVSSMIGPNDSTGTPSYQLTMSDGPDATSGALDSVYKSTNVNGAVYGYFYDAFNRRRAKQYPLGMEDEFYYRVDNQLLVDIGSDSTVSVGAHPLDEYVWLGGRPVAVIRSKLNTSYVRQADSNSSDCTRNGGYQSCGAFAIVTDHIGAPVLMLDDQQRVVGEGSMDPFGAINTVSLDKETAHPYANNTNATIADFKQPVWGTNTTTRLRVNFAFVDTETNNGTPVDSLALRDGDNGATLTSGIGGYHAGRMVSGWVTPSAGHVQVVFTSNGNNCCPVTGGGLDCSGSCSQAPNYPYSGVAMEGYEYQRYASGAQPAWIGLRYPGQYYDAESRTFQNWNRFDDLTTGRYLETEPLLQDPPKLHESTRRGFSAGIYSYAFNNPLYWTDKSGLYGSCNPAAESCLPVELPYWDCVSECVAETSGIEMMLGGAGAFATGTPWPGSLTMENGVTIPGWASPLVQAANLCENIDPRLASVVGSIAGMAAPILALGGAGAFTMGVGMSIACEISCAPQH